MHSLAMAQGIMQAVITEAEKREGKQIKTIAIKIRDEDFVESDSLQFCLETVAKGTIAEGAQIEIEIVSGKELPQVTLELR